MILLYILGGIVCLWLYGLVGQYFYGRWSAQGVGWVRQNGWANVTTFWPVILLGRFIKNVLVKTILVAWILGTIWTFLKFTGNKIDESFNWAERLGVSHGKDY